MKNRLLAPALVAAAFGLAACDSPVASPQATPVDRTPTLRAAPPAGPEVKLTASDAAAGDEFGFPTSIDGDLLIVGAQSGDADAAINSGSAYVFRRTGARWTEEAKLTASDAASGDAFGDFVSIDGDLAILGAFF